MKKARSVLLALATIAGLLLGVATSASAETVCAIPSEVVIEVPPSGEPMADIVITGVVLPTRSTVIADVTNEPDLYYSYGAKEAAAAWVIDTTFHAKDDNGNYVDDLRGYWVGSTKFYWEGYFSENQRVEYIYDKALLTNSSGVYTNFDLVLSLNVSVSLDSPTGGDKETAKTTLTNIRVLDRDGNQIACDDLGGSSEASCGFDNPNRKESVKRACDKLPGRGQGKGLECLKSKLELGTARTNAVFSILNDFLSGDVAGVVVGQAIKGSVGDPLGEFDMAICISRK